MILLNLIIKKLNYGVKTITESLLKSYKNFSVLNLIHAKKTFWKVMFLRYIRKMTVVN